jgi:hypothetical protein
MAHFFVGRSDVNLKNRWASIGGLNHGTSVPISASALPHPEQDTVGNPSPFVSSSTQANAAAMADAPAAPLAFSPPENPPASTEPEGGMLDLWAIDLEPPNPGSREDRWI